MRCQHRFARVKATFASVDSGQIRAVTNPITPSECLVHPVKNGLPTLRQGFIDVIVSGTNTTSVEIDQSVVEEATRIRPSYSLRLPGSLHLVTALLNGCDAFLTNDLQLKRITELKMLMLDELEAVVILGGIVTSTFLNLAVIPAFYLKFGGAETHTKTKNYPREPA